MSTATINSLTLKAVVDGTEIIEISEGGTGSFKTPLSAVVADYQLLSEKGAANGYAGLDASQQLLLANFPTGTALQVLRRNAANTALEFADPTGGSAPPFADTQPIIEGSVDATKLLRFEIDGFSTATTRVITPPDADIALVNTPDGLIQNANVGASAAIDFSKLAALTSANILVGSVANVATSVAMTGDISISNTGVTAIAPNVIVDADVNTLAGIQLSKLASIATSRILGRTTAGAGEIEELTGTQATTVLDSFGGTVKGLVPTGSGNNNTLYLDGTGNWTVPPGGVGGITTLNTLTAAVQTFTQQTDKILINSAGSAHAFTLGTDVVTIDQANTYEDFAQTFLDNILRINNPANTFAYTIVASAITANRNFTLPLLGSNDTFVAEDAAQTLTQKTMVAANNTFSGFGSSEIVEDLITGQTLKNTPVAADEILIIDSEAANVFKRATVGSLPGSGGITTLNTLTAAVQTFTPEANRILINSAGSAHAFTLGSDVAFLSVSNAWGDGVKQTFNPNATNAGINVGSHTADPSTPANGDFYYNSTSEELRARINGAWVALGAAGGGITTLNTLTATTQLFAVAQADELAINSVTDTHTFSIGANIPRLDEANTFTESITINNATASLIMDAATISTINNSTYNIATSSFQNINRARGNPVTPAAVADTDNLGTLSWNGHDATSFVTAATINAVVNGAVSTGVVDADMIFSVSDSGTVAEAMRIVKDGTLQLSGNLNIQGNNIINTGTLTLPTSTDTLVGRATTDTLTNKSILDSTNRVDIGTFEITAEANGDIIFRNGAGVWTRLAVGTANQVLTVSGGLPSWQNAAGGAGITSINSQTGAAQTLAGQTDKILINSATDTHTFTLGTDVVAIDQANTYEDFAQTFPDNQLFIQNPAATFAYQVIASAIAANRTVTLPLLTANDTFVMEGFAQTLTNKTLTTPTINGATLTGVLDAGTATSLEIPNSNTPTVDADGEIAIDNLVTDFDEGVIKYFSTAEMGVVAMPVAQFTSPTDGHVVAYNATDNNFELVPPGGGTGTNETIVKAADEPLSNSSMLQDDNELFVNGLEPGEYEYVCKIFFDSGTTPDFKYAFAGSGTFTAEQVNTAWNSSAASDVKDGTVQTTVVGGAATRVLAVYGKLVVTATTDFRLQWAQATADVSITTVLEGSSLTVKSTFSGGGGGAASPVSLVIKTMDESRPNDDMFQDDSQLTLPVAANTNYAIDFYMVGEGSPTGDIKYRFSVPTGATMLWGLTGENQTPVSETGQIVKAITTGSNRTNSNNGTLFVGGTAGNLTVQWAQNVSDATASTMKAGSYLTIIEE